jgi:hypothetical protein
MIILVPLIIQIFDILPSFFSDDSFPKYRCGAPLKWANNWVEITPICGRIRIVGKRGKPKAIVLKSRQVEVVQGQG